MRHGNIDLAKFIMAEETFPIPPYNSREQYLALQRNASSSCSFFFFFSFQSSTFISAIINVPLSPSFSKTRDLITPIPARLSSSFAY